MSYYMGIDLGTSGLKAVLVTPEGDVKGVGSGTYPIDIPRPGYAEQDPELWYTQRLARDPGNPGISQCRLSGRRS